MSSPYERLIDALERACCKPHATREGHRANCPCHEGADSGRSLHISEGRDGAPMCHCHKCKTSGVEVAKALGTSWREIMNGHERSRSPVERARESARKAIANTRTEYELRDIDGALKATHTRIDLGGGRKRFVWSTPTCANGLGGIPSTALPLYGAEHLAEVPEGALVIVCEGEKAAKSLIDRGYHAVGTACGSSATPDADVLQVLVACDVILWPDKAPDGMDHMARIADALDGVPSRLRVIRPPEAMKRKDDAADASDKVVDWLIRDAEEGDAAAILRGLKADLEDEPATEDQASTILYHLSADEIRTMTFPEADWLVEGFIFRDSVTVIHAPPKEGKSTMLYSLTKRLARGDAEWAGFRLVGKPCRILYLSESSARLVRAAIIKHDLGGNVIFAPNEERSVMLDASQVLAGIAQLVELHEPDVIVIDTMTSWGRMVGESENDSVVMQRVSESFRPFATGGRAVVVVHHSNKGGDVDPIQSLRGSSATAGAVDCVARVFNPNGGDDGTRRKVWAKGRMDEQNWQVWIDWDGLAQTFRRAEEPSTKGSGLSDAELERIALDSLSGLGREDPAASRFGFKRVADRARDDHPGESFTRDDIRHALDRMQKADTPLVTHTPKGYALAPSSEHETPPLTGADL